MMRATRATREGALRLFDEREREMRRQRAALLWAEIEQEERRRAGRGRRAAERREWWRVASRMTEWVEC